jgi:hypothetical protein
MALDSSVITTIWVGAFVVIFFNLRFGWMLTALIVPGYLTPLLIHKPGAVGVIVVEGIITYAIVWCYSEWLSKGRVWSMLFGMDRFFFMMLCAIFVRVMFDGWLLPLFGEWLNRTYHFNFDYGNNLHSFGLTMVALVGNSFMKPGIRKGMFTLTVNVFLTWFITYFILMKFTNFNMAGFSYLYEDVAQNVLASPKTYIIMLTAAFLACRSNLKYGWDFGGNVIPAFLALQWYDPLRIVATLGEVTVVLFVCKWLLDRPMFRTITMEKGRKVLLFFNVSFAFKMLLGFMVPLLFPGAKINDFFGFGYVLCALMAIQIHTEEIYIRFTNTTLQTSLKAVVVATGIGFTLSQFHPSSSWMKLASLTPQREELQVASPPEMGSLSLSDCITGHKLSLYFIRHRKTDRIPLPSEIESFRQGVRSLLNYVETKDGKELDQAKSLFKDIQYEVSLADDTYWVLREASGSHRGWGFFVINAKAANKMLVEVPVPSEEFGVLDGAFGLFKSFGARSFSVAGNLRRLGGIRNTDPLASTQTLLFVFHRELGRASTLQVRGLSAENNSGSRLQQKQESPNRLSIKRELPDGLDLVKLEGIVGPVVSRWGTLSQPNVMATLNYSGFAELELSEAVLWKAFSRQDGGAAGVADNHLVAVEKSLAQYLEDVKPAVALPGTSAYRVPSLQELMFMDEEVLTPLIHLVTQSLQLDPRSVEGESEILPIQRKSFALGYRLISLNDPLSGANYLVLEEDPKTVSLRHWGTYIFRVGPAGAFVIQAPRPVQEPGTLEFGKWAFEQMQGRLFQIAGALPLTNSDGSSDANQNGLYGNLFCLASQVVLRETGETPYLVIQPRAFSPRPDQPLLPRTDMLLSVAGDAWTMASLSDQEKAFQNLMERGGFTVDYYRGQPEAAGFAVSSLPTARYLKECRNKSFLAVWMSPFVRSGQRVFSDINILLHQINALRIPTREVDLYKDLGSFRKNAHPVSGAYKNQFQLYLERKDIVLLRKIQSDWPKIHLGCWLDRLSGRPFLVAGEDLAHPDLIASLSTAPSEKGDWKSMSALDDASLRLVLTGRTIRLEGGRL